MSQVPVQIIVAAFQDPNGASNALSALKDAQRKGVIVIEDAAVLHKDAEGKLHISETGDMGGGKGAVVGGIIGGIIGIIAGPPGVVLGAAAGAAVGGVTAKMVDAGFPDARLREIGESLKPNTSAIVALVDQVWVIEAERQMQEAGAKTMTAAISADIAKQLAEGKDVAFSAVSTDEGVSMTRVAAGGNDAEMSNLTATKDAIYIEDVTKKGDDISVGAAAITAAGAVVVEGTGKMTDAAAAPATEAPKLEAAVTGAPAASASAASMPSASTPSASAPAAPVADEPAAPSADAKTDKPAA